MHRRSRGRRSRKRSKRSRRSRSRKRSRSKRRVNKLTVRTTSSALSIYRGLRRDRSKLFADKYKFVNGTFTCKKGKVVIVLNGFHKIPPYRKIRWDDIRCAQLTRDIKVSPCTYGRPRDKVFYRKAKNLKEYITKINNNSITYPQHVLLINAIFSILPSKFVNSNGELAVLHFKEH